MLRIILALALCALFLQIGTLSRAQCGPQWLPGDGIPGVNGSVRAMKVWDPDGPGPAAPLLVVGGGFTAAGTVLAKNIAAWDGQKWSSLGEGFNANVRAIEVTDSNTLVVGGEFTMSGSTNTQSLAAWNGTNFVRFNGGVANAPVRALVSLPGNQLVVGGDFTFFGVLSNVQGIALWNGSAWVSMGRTNGNVQCLARLSSGEVVAGGSFTSIGGISARVARWNGSTWTSLSSVTIGGDIRALATLPNGDLLAGGLASFQTASGSLIPFLAAWNSGGWKKHGSDLNGAVNAFGVTSSGQLYVGGAFKSGSGSSMGRLARWEAGDWKLIGPLVPLVSSTISRNSEVAAICEIPDGAIAVAGFQGALSETEVSDLAAIDGDRWFRLGRGIYGAVDCMLELPSGETVVAGSFTSIHGKPFNRIAMTNGATWTAFGSGIRGGFVSGSFGTSTPSINVMLRTNAGDIVAAGSFMYAGDVVANSVARWRNGAWEAMGDGFPQNYFTSINAILELPDGRIVVAGRFDAAGNLSVPNIACWDGDEWAPLPGMTSSAVGAVNQMALAPNGDLIFTGATRVARWDGSAWNIMGAVFEGGHSTGVAALSISNVGEIVIGGDFTKSGSTSLNHVARWTGLDWAPLGSGIDSTVYSLVHRPTGELLAGTRIRSWNGSEWTDWGDPQINVAFAIHAASFGDLFVGTGHSNSGPSNVLQSDSRVFGTWARHVENAKPRIAISPKSQSILRESELAILATPASDYPGVSFSWSRESAPGLFTDIQNGPAGASEGGGLVSNASGQLPSPTDGTPATLTITNIKHSDAGNYRITFFNSCGEATSIPVAIKVKAHPVDLNADGMVDDSDFVLFTTQYDLMLCDDPSMPDFCPADFNHDGLVDDADFSIFIPAYDIMLFQ